MTDNTNIQELTDTELISRYKTKKDKSVIGELFKRYVQFVLAICMKYFKNLGKSEEAVMQIFEKLFSELLKHDVSNFKSWLHVVTKNHCLNTLRKESYHKEKENELKYSENLFMENENSFHHDNEDNKEHQIKKLEDGIKNLPETQQKCIELFYLKEKTYEEVANITGYPLNKVKSYIQNGKRNLKIYLTKK